VSHRSHAPTVREPRTPQELSGSSWSGVGNRKTTQGTCDSHSVHNYLAKRIESIENGTEHNDSEGSDRVTVTLEMQTYNGPLSLLIVPALRDMHL